MRQWLRREADIKITSQRHGVKLQTEVKCLRIGFNVLNFCEHGSETSGYTKNDEFIDAWVTVNISRKNLYTWHVCCQLRISNG
jgi:hypothetical protein